MNFFDTNIFVYAVSGADDKRGLALETLAKGGVISAQVLSEFTNVALKKMKLPWSEIEQAIHRVELVVSDVIPVTRQTHAMAVELARGHMLHWFDAMIVASALGAGCDRLLTEDLQDGRKFGKLTVANPFV